MRSRIIRIFSGVLCLLVLHGLPVGCGKGEEITDIPPDSSTPSTTPTNTVETVETKETINNYPAQNRYVSVGGRTVISGYVGVDGVKYPLAGVGVHAIVNGSRKDTTSDSQGYWGFGDVPVRMSGGSADAANNLIIYYDLTYFNSNSTTINLAELAAASSETPSKNYQIDVGLIDMVPQVLKFSSNVIRATNSSGNFSQWVGSSETVGASNADAENIYLADTSANITLSFNMAVDTTRAGTQFVMLKNPRGVAVAYAGSWNSAGTVFTVNPSSNLTASPYKADKYSFSFLAPLYPSGNDYQLAALSGTTVSFNVMDSSSAPPLTTQAPTAAPEVDASGSNILSYTFAHNTTLKNGVVTTGGLTDVFTTGSSTAFRFNINSNRTYKVYSRNLPGTGAAASAWTDRTASCSGGTYTTYPDMTATCLLSIYGFTSNASTLANGENLQFVVTELKGSEESPTDTTSPLAVADLQKPYVYYDSNAGSSNAYSATTAAAPRLNAATNVVTGRMTTTFTEPMGNATPSYAALSGGLTAFSQNSGTGRWTSNTAWAQDVTLTFAVPATTLGQAHTVGETKIKVASLTASTAQFTVGDVILIAPTSSPTSQTVESVTVSAVDGFNAVLTTSALTKNHSSGENVLLLNSATNNPGLTAFRSAVATSVRAGSTTVTVSSGTGSRFYVGEGLSFFRLDPTGTSGFLTAVTATIASISSDTITLVAPLANGLVSGTLVLDSGQFANVASLREPGPRTPTNLTSTDKVLFDSTSSASTTLTSNQAGLTPDVLPAAVTVASTSGFLVGDVVTVSASSTSNTSTLTADVANAATSLPVGDGTQFQPGDVIELVGLSASVAVAASTTVATASGTTLTLSAARDTRVNDLFRFSEAAASTTVSTAISSAAATGQSLVVASTTGMTVGQQVQFDDRILAAPLVLTITAVNSSTSLTVSGFTAGQVVNIGAVVTKPEMKDEVTVTTAGTTAVVTIAGGFSTTSSLAGNLNNGFTSSATVTHIRRNRRSAVTAVSTNTLTVTAVGGGFPSASTVNVVSEPETLVVKTIPSTTVLTFGSSFRFSHRLGTAVAKTTQTSITVGASQLGNVMVGDAITIEAETSIGNANAKKDRFQATVLAFDTASSEVRVSVPSSVSGYYDFAQLANAELVAMGDAVAVTGAQDSNGNSFETAHGYRVPIATNKLAR